MVPEVIGAAGSLIFSWAYFSPSRRAFTAYSTSSAVLWSFSFFIILVLWVFTVASLIVCFLAI